MVFIQSAYKNFLKDEINSHIMNPIMNIYTIIRFIDESPFSAKQFYIRVLTSQFSPHELVLFFYHALHSEGSARFREYILKYGMLQNLERQNLYNYQHFVLYEKSAYG
jgi:hypothetical protein